MQEGQVWEALMSASHYKLNNLIAFLDHNHLQIDGNITEVMSPSRLWTKFVLLDGMLLQLTDMTTGRYRKPFARLKVRDKPTMIIAETVKGKGVSFMENVAEWHGSPPNKEERTGDSRVG